MALPSREALISVNARGEAAACGWWFLLTVFAISERQRRGPVDRG